MMSLCRFFGSVFSTKSGGHVFPEHPGPELSPIADTMMWSLQLRLRISLCDGWQWMTEGPQSLTLKFLAS